MTAKLTSLLSHLAILFAGTCVAYAPVLIDLGHDWMRDPNYSHGVLIPAISVYLLWRQRERFAALPRRPALAGFPGVIAALGLLVIGTAGAEAFTQRISLIVLIASTVLFLLGWHWLRATLFPITLLLLAIPLPYVIYYSLTAPMQTLAAKLAVIGLKGTGIPVVAQGNMLHLPENLSLEVAEACSGIRSLYAFLALGALIAYFTPLPMLGKVVVFLATIPLSILANSFRVWATSLAAYFWGAGVTKGLVHELFGLLVFATALVFFFLVRKVVRRLWRSAS